MRTTGHVRGTTWWRCAAVLTVVVLAGGWLQPVQAAAPPQAKGQVVAADGSGPLAGIQVCAETRPPAASTWERYRCATTAEDGSYAIALKPGTYRFVAEDASLYGNWLPQRHGVGKAYVFTASTTRNISFTLARGASVTGTLTAPSGVRPGNNYVWVQAFRVASDGTTATSPSGFSNVTGGGYFDVSKLPAGTYKLYASDNTLPHVFAQQWYPDATTASGASTVTVGAGAVSRGHDMTLTAPVSLTVSMRRVDGRPARGNFEVYDMDGRQVGTAGDNYPTSATFAGLHPGTYKVRGTDYAATGYTEWYSQRHSAATARPVDVGPAPSTSLTFTFHPPALQATKKPTVKLVGTNLRSTTGTWSKKPDGTRLELVRDGKVVNDDIATVYFLSRKDVGHRLKVCAVTWRRGYDDGRACSSYSAKVKRYY